MVWLLGSGLWFLTGTLFPVSSLPTPLQVLSRIIPITYLLDGLRLALIEGAPDGTFASGYPSFEWILAHTPAPQRGRFFMDTSPGAHSRHAVLLLIWDLMFHATGPSQAT